MHKTMAICMAIMACVALNFGFGGESVFHDIALIYSGWLLGWLFIMVHDEYTDYRNKDE